MIDIEAFRAGLAADGFAEPVERALPPEGDNGTHTHPFEVRALVVEGSLTLRWDGREERYGPGGIFRMAANHPHSEEVGPEGVRYLSGRKII